MEFLKGNTSYRFVRQFENYLEDRVDDEEQEISYLVYRCTGQAGDSLQQCVLLPPDSDYTEAVDVMGDLCRQKYRAARSCVDGLSGGVKTVHEDPDALMKIWTKMLKVEVFSHK